MLELNVSRRTLFRDLRVLQQAGIPYYHQAGKGYHDDFANIPLDVDGDGLPDVITCCWFATRTDWYRNILADGRVTVQTNLGTQSMLARPVNTTEELASLYDFTQESPAARMIFKLIGFNLTREEFAAQKERWCIVTFDPTDQPTPPGVEADLVWLWPLVGVVFLLGWISGRRSLLK
jgi:hypothetical protein